MTEKLTRRQTEVLSFIRSFAESESMPPTLREIARGMGFASDNAARDHVRALARRGAIELVEGASRGIRLVDDGVPVIGRVAAGAPILATENIDRHVPVKSGLFSQTPDYFLQVVGESMRDVGILDGDLLAVKRTSEVRDGQIVVARVDDDVTVKRLSRHPGYVELLPENAEFKPIRIEAGRHELAIEGLALGVVREL